MAELAELTELTGRQLGLTAVRGRLLLPKEIAVFLRVSERWVQKHMKDGTFPVQWRLVGERDRVVDSAALDDWLKKIVIEAGTAPLPLRAIRKVKRR